MPPSPLLETGAYSSSTILSHWTFSVSNYEVQDVKQRTISFLTKTSHPHKPIRQILQFQTSVDFYNTVNKFLVSQK